MTTPVQNARRFSAEEILAAARGENNQVVEHRKSALSAENQKLFDDLMKTYRSDMILAGHAAIRSFKSVLITPMSEGQLQAFAQLRNYVVASDEAYAA